MSSNEPAKRFNEAKETPAAKIRREAELYTSIAEPGQMYYPHRALLKALEVFYDEMREVQVTVESACSELSGELSTEDEIDRYTAANVAVELVFLANSFEAMSGDDRTAWFATKEQWDRAYRRDVPPWTMEAGAS